MCTPFFILISNINHIFIKKDKYMASIINKFQENYSIITIHGTKEIYIENFITISTLTDTEVTVKSSSGIISIVGTGLLMEYFNKTDIKISGTILSINFKEVCQWPS